MVEQEKLLAVYMDIDNAFPDFSGEKLRYVFDKLAGIGEVVLCRGYADWGELANKRKEAFQWNVNTINLFTRGVLRKNAADIAIAVDAVEQLYTVKEITTFVLVCGDSDLAPLATKLREKGKEVIGISRKAVTSQYLVKACSKFFYLEDLMPSPQKLNKGNPEQLNSLKDKLVQIIAEKSDKGETIHASQLKRFLLEKVKNFDEKKFGFKTFTDLLEFLPEIEVTRSSTGLVSLQVSGAVKVEESPEEAKTSEEIVPLSLEESIDVLVRAAKACRKPDGKASLTTLKTTMLRIAPHFSEKELGYSKFIDFIRSQKSLIKIENVSPALQTVELLEK